MKGLYGFHEDFQKIYEHLKATDTSTAKLVFCERMDEKSCVWNLNRHSHNYMELIYILDGKMQIDVPGKKFSKGFYNLIVYPRSVVHQEIVDMQDHQEILCLGIKAQSETKLETSFEISDDDGSIRWLMEQIFREEKQQQSDCERVLQAYIAVLYIKMQRYFENTEQLRLDFVGRCISYIRDHLPEELTVEQLAAAVFVSPSHLTRSFRQRIGMPPLSYIRSCRVNLARHALIATDDNIEEIAISVGFRDPKYFSRVFRMETGLCPREYRQKYTELLKGENRNGRT